MSSPTPHEPVCEPSLKSSRYDRVASMLISTLILSGASVAVLFVLWLSTHQDVPRSFKLIQFVGEHGENSPVGTEELDAPQLAELSDAPLIEPVVELSTLLSSEVVAVAAQLDTASITTAGGGRPDIRVVGPPSKEIVPRWERWELRYEAASLEGYAKQLDYFGIELGAAGGKRQVDYASKLAAATPVTRTGEGSEEQRLYLTWRGGRLEVLDRQLLQKAGIDVKNRIVMQFYPQRIEDLLARVELDYTKDGKVESLRKTIFGVRATGDGYDFFIIEQRQ
jgi:hypothetical protein